MVLVHYWITSSKSWIDLVDFFDNHDVTFSSPVYFMIDGALKRKEGQFFGDIRLHGLRNCCAQAYGNRCKRFWGQ